MTSIPKNMAEEILQNSSSKKQKKIQAKVLKFNFENISLRWYIRREYVELKNKEKVEILGRKR